MPRRTNTRARILEIAERHMMQRGYHAFSFKDIAVELGIKPAAVHYHFPTKPELILEVLRRYGARFEAWRGEVEPLPAAQRLVAYIDVGRDVVAAQRVCALGMLNTQLLTVPPEVRTLAVHTQERILEFYATSLEVARAGGDVHFEGSVQDKAFEVACALIGAQQLALAMGPEAFERAMRPLASSLGLPSSTLRVAEVSKEPHCAT